MIISFTFCCIFSRNPRTTELTMWRRLENYANKLTDLQLANIVQRAVVASNAEVIKAPFKL